MAKISFDANLIEQNSSGVPTMVGFDIDQMSTDTHLLLEQYHIFSKTPAAPGTTLGGARNKAGHTTTSSDIWSQEIPAFFKAYSGDDLTRFAALAKKNDLVVLAYTKSETEPNGAVLKFVDGAWTKIHDSIASIPDGTEFYNSVDTKPVLRFHQNSAAVILSGDNNNTDGSNGFSAKICAWDEANSAPYAPSALKFVPQFVSPMDKMVSGIPSSGYDAIVKVGTTEDDILAESPSSPAGYIANNYAGIIHFNTAKSDNQIYVHAFEYIGDKLDASLSGIRKDVQDIIGTTMEGVVASVGTNDAATSAGIGVDSTTKTSPKITFTAGSVAANETKLVSGGAVKTYVDTTALASDGSIAKYVEDYVATNAKVSVNGQAATTITVKGTEASSADLVKVVVTEDKSTDNKIGLTFTATIDEAVFDNNGNLEQDGIVIATIAEKIADSAIKDAIETDSGAIKDAIDGAISDATLEGKVADATSETETKLVTAAQVKEYVEENAQVTISDGTTVVKSSDLTDFILTGSTGDDITISSELEELVPGDGSKIGVVTYSATLSKATVDSSTGAITAGGSLAVSASDAKTITDKAIAALSATGGAIATLTERVGEAEASASASAQSASASESAAKSAESAAKSAQSAAEAAQSEAAASKTAAEAAQGEASSSASAAQAAQSAAQGSATSASQSASAASASAQSAAESEAAAIQAAADAKAAKDFVEATAEWQAGTEDTLGNFTDATKDGVVTGTTVKTVADEVLTLAKSYSDSLHTTSLDYVVLGDSESLPRASAETLGKIYLLKEGNNSNLETGVDAISGDYVEYMTRKVSETEYTWEKIGTTAADLSAYAKTADLNVTSTTANGLTYSQTNGVVSVSVDAATTSKVGTVQLTDGYTSTDDTKAATGKSIATAIDALDSSKSVNGITVNQENGVITSVTEELITASVPEGTTKVEGNVAYVGSTKHVIAPEKFQTAVRMPTTLTSWVADLSNLTNGDNMFFDCGLTTFVGDLSSLTSGTGMF